MRGWGGGGGGGGGAGAAHPTAVSRAISGSGSLSESLIILTDWIRYRQ